MASVGAAWSPAIPANHGAAAAAAADDVAAVAAGEETAAAAGDHLLQKISTC